MTSILVSLFLTLSIFAVNNDAVPFGMSRGLDGGLPLQVQLQLLQLRFSCFETSGSDAGYQQFVAAYEPSLRCMLRYVDVPQLAKDLQTVTDSTREVFIEHYCLQFHNSFAAHCYDGLAEGIAMCLSEDTDRLKAIFLETMEGLLQLICKDNGAILLETRSPLFKTCLNKLKEDTIECKTFQLGPDQSISQFGVDECLKFKESRKCLEEEMKACNTSAILDIIDTIYKPIAKANKCEMQIGFNGTIQG